MKQTFLSRLLKRDSLFLNASFLLGFFFFLAFLGLLDAIYIAYTHYAHIIPPCFTGGCETVLTSKYTELVGIPNAVWGIGYYALVMILVWIYWKNHPGVARDGERTEPSEGVRLLDKRGTLNSSAGNERDRSEFRGWRATGPRISTTILSFLLVLTLLGLFVGIYLIYLQAAIIHAYCQYCLFSELIDFLLFDCAWWLWRKSSNKI